MSKKTNKKQSKKRSQVNIQFKDGSQKQIQMDSRIVESVYASIAFVVGLVIAWSLKK